MNHNLPDIPEFIEKLQQCGINLRADGGIIRIRGPAELLTPELREIVRENKPELIEFLASLADSQPAESIEQQPPTKTAPRREHRQLTGNGFPGRPTPHVPPAILADPVRLCVSCGRVRVLRAVPGSLEGVCFHCWLSGSN